MEKNKLYVSYVLSKVFFVSLIFSFYD